MYESKTEDVNEDFISDKEKFDFSNYATQSEYYDHSNKLVLGKMKDETLGIEIKEFVEIKPKMYSFFADNRREHEA